jgi:hypothetical protein
MILESFWGRMKRIIDYICSSLDDSNRVVERMCISKGRIIARTNSRQGIVRLGNGGWTQRTGSSFMREGGEQSERFD